MCIILDPKIDKVFYTIAKHFKHVLHLCELGQKPIILDQSIYLLVLELYSSIHKITGYLIFFVVSYYSLSMKLHLMKCIFNSTGLVCVSKEGL